MSFAERISFVDQHGGPRGLAELLGRAAALVHAGRAAGVEAAALGRTLHARLNPANDPRPAVAVIPVVDLAEVPAMFHGLVRGVIRGRSPDVTVWIDFHGGLRDSLALSTAAASVVALDGAGGVAAIETGPFDTAVLERLVATLEALRA
ncbi:MAG: hypothetical protein EBZ74_04625 [Planctomycetia bacterium]|nr:hypothetical protein [Planctomycetia bacterium]